MAKPEIDQTRAREIAASLDPEVAAVLRRACEASPEPAFVVDGEDLGPMCKAECFQLVHAHLFAFQATPLGLAVAQELPDSTPAQIAVLLDHEDKTFLSLMLCCDGMLPAWSPRAAKRGWLAENGLLSPEGRAIAEEVVLAGEDCPLKTRIQERRKANA